MRFVSWFIVIGSVGWLMASRLGPMLDDIRWLDVDSDQVTGTSLATLPGFSPNQLQDLARRYTDAWNSHDPSQVAGFYAADGSLTINRGDAFEGKTEVAGMARGFLRDFPDMKVSLRRLEVKDGKVEYHWTFTGTHAETGNPVRIDGVESWLLTPRGEIAQSTGRFDAEDLSRQVARDG